MQFHIGCRAELSAARLDSLARYRHAVFVESMHWDLPCRDGREEDAFDRDDTVYVYAMDEAGRIGAFARLIPTTQSYPLATLFPELLDGRAAPCDAGTFELSRFSATGADVASAAAAGDSLSSPLAVELLRHTLLAARRHGARRLVTVSPLGIESLLAKAGFQAGRFAGPVRIGGKRWVVCDIGVEQNLHGTCGASASGTRRLLSRAAPAACAPEPAFA